MVVEAAGVGVRPRAHTVVNEYDGALACREELGVLSLVDWGAGSLVGTRCIDHTVPQVRPMLLEAISDVPDLLIIAELAVGLEFA